MPVDEMDEFAPPPRKWLDKKQYVRIDPQSGKPQLIRVEPVIAEDGEFIPDQVTVYIDEEMVMMDRASANALIKSMDCSPLEITAQWKHQKIN